MCKLAACAQASPFSDRASRMQLKPRAVAMSVVERPEDTAQQICCSMTSVLLRLVRSEGGDAAVTRLLERAGVEYEPAYLESTDNWVSLDEACAMLQGGV